MRVEYVSRGDVFSVKLMEKLTFSDHVVFRKLIEEVKDAKSKTCIFDVAQMDMIDSSGLGMLMIAHDEAQKAGFELKISNANGPVKQLLKLSRMDQLLKVA